MTDEAASEQSAVSDDEADEPVLLVFLLGLPDPLPVAHGSTWTQQTDYREPLLDGQEMRALPHLPPANWSRGGEGYNFVSLRFWQVLDDQADVPEFVHRFRLAGRVAQSLTDSEGLDPEGQGESLLPKSEAYQTVVEAVTFVAQADDLFATPEKPDPLTRCIDTVLEFHNAYRIAARAYIPELTYERIHPIVRWYRKPAFEPEARPEPAGLMFLSHSNIPVEAPEPLSDEQLDALAQRQARARVGDPFMLYAKRRLQAEIEIHTNGRPGESVVQIGIAAEVLLGAILGLAMWEEHKRGELTVEQAAEVLSLPLATRIKQQYGRFGGKTFPDADPVKHWQTNIADVRNRVVHAGFDPDREQAYAAGEALLALEKYVGDRLFAMWEKYPRTAWLFLGESGFHRRGKKKLQKAQEWSSTEGLRPVDWIRDYQAWREQVNALVVHGR